MRCPDCNKFVSHEARAEWYTEPELTKDEITATIRIVLDCAECGNELAEITEDIAEPVEVDNPDDLTLEYDDPDVDDYFQQTDRHGKKIKSMRYQKHMYLASAEVRYGEESVTLSTSPFQGSEFEPLN